MFMYPPRCGYTGCPTCSLPSIAGSVLTGITTHGWRKGVVEGVVDVIEVNVHITKQIF